MSLVEASEVPDVSVCVLAYRQTDRLDTVLSQLREHESAAAFEVVVVANDVPAEVDEVLGGHRWIQRIDSKINRGFGGGNNLAARHARGRLLALLNDDAEITEGWLDALTAVMQRRPDCAAVASVMVDENGTVLEAGGAISAHGDVWPPDRGKRLADIQGRGPRRVGYATGGSLLVRSEVFRDVGGFDLDYHPAYFEDADLSCRLWRAGHEVLSTTASVVIHAESASNHSAAKRALQLRNGSIFRGRWAASYRGCVPNMTEGQSLEPAPSRRVLFVDDRVPRHGVGSGAGRTRQNVLAIAAAGFDVSFHPREPAAELDSEMAAAGVELVQQLSALDPGHLDAVVISRPHNHEFWPALRSAHPDAKFVYDAEARFSARLEKQLELGIDYGDRPALEAELAELLTLETGLAQQADALVTISTDEQIWFEGVDGGAEVHLIDPFPDLLENRCETTRDPRLVVFVAGWEAGANSPNGDALRWLAEEVVPRLTARGLEIDVAVTGGGVPDELRDLESDSLRFVGKVESLDELHRSAAAAVVPTRYGAGVKLKIVHALATATPVVATSVGAEGLALKWRRHVSIADSADRFADELAVLLTDADEWDQRHQAMRETAAEHTSDAAAAWARVLGSTVEEPKGPS